MHPGTTIRSEPDSMRAVRPGLLSVRDLSVQEIDNYLQSARRLRGQERIEPLSGLVLQVFFEHSTRTRTSFEIAARRLGLESVNLDVAQSSVAKGEGLEDMIRTIDAMDPDVLVVRHDRAGSPERIAALTRAAVVNAGDGAREHPTQALLDTLTLCDHFGHTEVEQLAGLRVALVGDIAHSRVARSNLAIWSRVGAEVRLVGPRAFVPPGFAEAGYSVHHELDSGVRGADLVYTLRVQTERQHGVLYPSFREYHRHFGLSRERLDRLAPGAVVLHPGPVNRGVELAADVLSDERCLVDRQVANGVWMRMAVLQSLFEARRGGSRG